MTPTIEREPWEVDRLTRGRDLTDREIAKYLASRQTALRHATADVGTEIAEVLRDRLREAATLDRIAPDGLADVAREMVERGEAFYRDRGPSHRAFWNREIAALRKALESVPADREPPFGWHNDGDSCTGPGCLNMAHDEEAGEPATVPPTGLREAARNVSDRRTPLQDGWWISQKEMRALDAALEASPVDALGVVLDREDEALTAIRDIRAEVAGSALTWKTSREVCDYLLKFIDATLKDLIRSREPSL